MGIGAEHTLDASCVFKVWYDHSEEPKQVLAVDCEFEGLKSTANLRALNKNYMHVNTVTTSTHKRVGPKMI